MNNCPVCGGIIPEGVTSCPSCGAFLNNQNQAVNVQQQQVSTNNEGQVTLNQTAATQIADVQQNVVPVANQVMEQGIPDLSKSQVMDVQQQVAAQEQALIDAAKEQAQQTAPPQEEQDPNAPQAVSVEQIQGAVTNPNEKPVDYSEEAAKIKGGPSKFVITLVVVLVVGLAVFGALWFIGQ